MARAPHPSTRQTQFKRGPGSLHARSEIHTGACPNGLKMSSRCAVTAMNARCGTAGTHALHLSVSIYRGTVGIERRWAFGSRTQLPEAKVTVKATVASNSIHPQPTPPFEFKPPALKLNIKLEITAIAAVRDGFRNDFRNHLPNRANSIHCLRAESMPDGERCVLSRHGGQVG